MRADREIQIESDPPDLTRRDPNPSSQNPGRNLLSRDYVLTIVGEWAKVFGEAVKVNVAWSHSKCTFVSKP